MSTKVIRGHFNPLIKDHAVVSMDFDAGGALEGENTIIVHLAPVDQLTNAIQPGKKMLVYRYVGQYGYYKSSWGKVFSTVSYLLRNGIAPERILQALNEMFQGE